MNNLKFKVSFAILLSFMLVSTCFAGKGFSDVEGTKYELAVRALDELEIIDTFFRF